MSPDSLHTVLDIHDIEPLFDTKFTSTAWTAYDDVKLRTALDGLSKFMTRLHEILPLLQAQEMEYFVENRRSILAAVSAMKRIDAFLGRAFQHHVGDHEGLLAATRLSMETVHKVLLLRRRSDLAISYSELKHLVMSGVQQELEACSVALAQFVPLDILNFSKYSPAELLEKFHVSPDAVGGMPVPVFSDSERANVAETLALERRLEPLRVSMEYLEVRVSEYTAMCGCWFSSTTASLLDDLARIQSQWKDLILQFAAKEQTALDTRVFPVVKHLLETAAQMSKTMYSQLDSGPDFASAFDNVRADFKTCSAIVGLLNNILRSANVPDLLLKAMYNTDVIPLWQKLNDLVQRGQHVELRQLRLSTPQAEQRILSPVLAISGIDLKVNVDPSPSIPVSINKADRIIDLGLTTVPRRHLSAELMTLTKDGDHALHWSENARPINLPIAAEIASSELTILPVQLKLQSPVLLKNEKRNQITVFESKMSTKSLLASISRKFTFKSKIPTIVRNYASLQLPVLKKMYVSGYAATRIPSISPDNPVFCSPDRRTQMSHETHESPRMDLSTVIEDAPDACDKLQSPPVFQMQRINLRRSSSTDGSVVLADLTNMSRNSSLRANSRKFSLNGMTTPDLSYAHVNSDEITSPLSWRSTSPDRPGSSIGSRFDEKHLVQPIKSTRKPWK